MMGVPLKISAVAVQEQNQDCLAITGNLAWPLSRMKPSTPAGALQVSPDFSSHVMEDLRTTRLIPREADPPNLESPFEALDERLTPTDLFYVRCHFPIPTLDPTAFRFTIGGAIQQKLSFSLRDLQSMPSVTLPATLECAGNGRIFLNPPARGVQWRLGAVGNAEWTGVPLSHLLREAGVQVDAHEVVLVGADRGMPKEPPLPPNEIAYARGVSIPDSNRVLLAWAMNDEPLTPEHGFPLRAIVPGYYAMASVKWLVHAEVATEPFQGYYQTADYAYWDESSGQPVRRPLASMPVKSSIARPISGEVLPRETDVTIFGAAWSGGSEIDQVDVSTDGGATWALAQFLDPGQPNHPGVWRRWQFSWRTPSSSGDYVLMSRATDIAGNIQASAHNQRYGSYVIDHIVPITVTIR
jgi:DMSO/TMAO reductase YedYZ molybdopterin-dependent catalytic subunit